MVTMVKEKREWLRICDEKGGGPKAYEADHIIKKLKATEQRGEIPVRKINQRRRRK